MYGLSSFLYITVMDQLVAFSRSNQLSSSVKAVLKMTQYSQGKTLLKRGINTGFFPVKLYFEENLRIAASDYLAECNINNNNCTFLYKIWL